MPKVPEFLLKALYEKGSLQIVGSGFTFNIKNELGPVRIIGASPLQMDRKPVPMEKSSFVHGETIANFSDVTAEKSVLMRKGESLKVKVEEFPLKPGRHTITISVIVKDMGAMKFSVSDQAKQLRS